MTWVMSLTSIPRAATSVATRILILFCLELVECALALTLGLAAVDSIGIEAAGDELVAESFDAALGLVKDYSLVDTWFTRISCSLSSFSLLPE